MKNYFLFAIVVCSMLGNATYAQDLSGISKVKQLLLNGENEKAITLINNLLNEDSTNFDLLYNLGLAHQKLFQYNKAKDALYKAYEQKKFDVPLLLTLGRNYKYMGASNYATMFFEQALDVDTSNTGIKLELANAYMENDDFVKAEKLFNELFQKDSTNSYVCKQLAYCNFKLDNDEESIKLYTLAQELNDYDATIPIQLGNLLVRKEEYEKAFAVVKRGLNENGSNQHLNRLAAEILFKLKRYYAAQFQYESLISNGDVSAVHYQRLGFCYYISASELEQPSDSLRVDKITKAAVAFANAVKLDESDALSWMYCGLSYKALDSLETSNRLLHLAIEKMIPDFIDDAYAHLGNNYELLGDYKDAIHSYRKASEYNPNNINITFQLAAIYDKYYADKKIPLQYYQRFVNEYEGEDEALVDYANTRIEALKEYLHFRM